MMLMIFVMILLFGVELLGYRLWLRKAKRNARELGIFTPTHSSRWLSFLRSIWIFVFWALMVIPCFSAAPVCVSFSSPPALCSSPSAEPCSSASRCGKGAYRRKNAGSS